MKPDSVNEFGAFLNCPSLKTCAFIPYLCRTVATPSVEDLHEKKNLQECILYFHSIRGMIKRICKCIRHLLFPCFFFFRHFNVFGSLIMLSVTFVEISDGISNLFNMSITSTFYKSSFYNANPTTN